MHILTDDQIGSVAGGLLPLVAALAFVASHTGEIQAFCEGFFEGLED